VTGFGVGGFENSASIAEEFVIEPVLFLNNVPANYRQRDEAGLERWRILTRNESE
jgi:hypothetical protein